jgi:acyl carrier protein
VNPDIMSQIREIAGDIFGVDQVVITEKSSTESLPGWDSLQHINFILALEDKFKVSFSPEEIEAVRSIRDAARILDKKLAG